MNIIKYKFLPLIILIISFSLCAAENDSLSIASISFVPKKWDKAAIAQKMDSLIRIAAEKGGKLIILPEGILEGYVVNEVIYEKDPAKKAALTKKFNEIAEPENGPFISRFYRLAGELNIYLILGYLEKQGDKTYNCAVLIGTDGKRIGRYYKTHFWQGYDINPPGYTPGNSFPVFKIGRLNAGIMICADRQFPEVARALTVNGADLIVCPAYGGYGKKNTAMMRTRANENQVYVVFSHPKQSLIIDNNADIIGECKTDEIIIRKIPWKSIKKTRPTIIYRRPEIYKDLIKPHQKQ